MHFAPAESFVSRGTRPAAGRPAREAVCSLEWALARPARSRAQNVAAVRQLAPHMTRFERATQIWSILAFAARSRQVLNYGILSRMTGILPHHLGQFLEPVQSYCLFHNLPPLTAIVVQESTGLPGLGFSASENVALSQMRVFAEEWWGREVPRAQHFEEATAQRPSRGTQSVPT